MRTLKLGLLALMFGSLSGCGPATPEPNADGPEDKDAAAKSKLAKVKEVYEAFDHTACKKGDNCARLFAQRAGLDLGPSGNAAVPNPRKHLPNPDAAWIPEWPKLPNSEAGAHYVFEALTLAAVRKSWRASCELAYGEYAKKLGERVEKMEQAIAEKNREPNPYDRLGGLYGLAVDKPDKGNLGEFKPGSDAVRYRWEAALFEAFEDTGRTFVYAVDGYPPSDELIAVLHPRQPKEYEREAFCIEAAAGRVPEVPAPPDTSSWDVQVRDMVSPVVPEERIKAVEARRKELADVTKAKFAKVKVANPQLPTGVREMTQSKIQSFSRDGRGARITSVVTREERGSLSSGKTRVTKIDDNAVMTFADWPSNLVLAPGDSVTFYGAELSVKEIILKSTPELEHRSREYKIEGKHVTRATAGGKTTTYFR